MRSFLRKRAVARYCFIIALCLVIVTAIQAQSDTDPFISWQAAESPNQPLLIIALPTPVDSSLVTQLSEHQGGADYNLLLLSDNDDLSLICERINAVLNKYSINKKRVYLLGLMPEEQRVKYQLLDTKIIAATQWANPSDVFKENYLNDIWQQLYQRTLWTFDVEAIKRKTEVVERNERVEGGIGLNLMTASTNFRSAGLGIPSGMRFWSYNAYRRVYPRWFFNFSVDVGLNFPNPQEVIFDQVIGQVDIFSILSGDEVEVDLDTEVTGHWSGAIGAGLSYLLPQKGKTTPYVGLDMRFFAANFIHLNIDTTIVIDGSNGVSGPGDFDFGEDNEDLTTTDFFYLTLCPKIGIYQELGERWLIDLNASYQPDPASFRGEDEHFSLLRFSMGLRYRLRGKRTTRYEYLRIAPARP